MKVRSDELEILLAVVDSGGFSAAAEQLGMQVAKVSRAVSKVEQQLGVSILHRTTRRMELSEEGRRYVEQVRIGLASLQQAEDAVAGEQEQPTGLLRVDAASPFILHQLVPLAAEFHRAYPQIVLDLSSHEGVIDLLEHRVDLAIRIAALRDSSLHARTLGESPLLLVAAPSYLAEFGEPQDLGDLKEHQLLGFSGHSKLNIWPLEGRPHIHPQLSASNGEVLRKLTLQGLGIACLSRFMIQNDLSKGELVEVLATQRQAIPEREQISAVYYRSSKVSSRVSAFLDFIQPRIKL